MTYEQAVYYKLLVLCGYDEELHKYIDEQLQDQDPLSDIIVELSFVNYDRTKLLCVLDEHILQAKETEIDYDNAVFNMVMSFFREKYESKALSLGEISELMYQVAVKAERELGDPWQAMILMDTYYGLVKEGIFDMDSFIREFEAFVIDGIYPYDALSPPPIKPKKETLLEKFLRKIKIIK